MGSRLSRLLTELPSFFERKGQLLLQHVTEKGPRPGPQLQVEFPEFYEVDSFHEALPDCPRLAELCALRLRELWRREAAESLSEALARPAIAWGKGTLSALEAERQLSLPQDRSQRTALERRLGEHLWNLRTDWRRRDEADARLLDELGFSSWPALWDKTSDGRLSAALESAQAFLQKTEDGYREVLSHALRKALPEWSMSIRPTRSDLHFAARAPGLDSCFSRAEYPWAVDRWLDEAGLSSPFILQRPDGQEPPPEALAVPLRLPDQVVFVSRPATGLPSLHSWMAERGRALFFASRQEEPPHQRWLFASHLPRLAARLFSGCAREPGWLRRYLKLPRELAPDAARMAAFFELTSLRQLCACALLAHSRPASEGDFADAYREQMRSALRVDAPRGFVFFDARDWRACAEELLAEAMAEPARRRLRERFDEDYWRNPRAKDSLLSLFSEREEGNETQREKKPSLLPAAEGLLSAMNP
jgi:hypothetical protein